MADAARLVGLSVRQLRRLRRAYRRRGAAALAHGNRGHPSPRRLSGTLRRRIIRLARTTYAAVNHSHFTELLRDREGVRVSRQTVSRLLHHAGVPSPRRRRPPKHRTRRERLPQEGMLVQFDGSHHAWLEARGTTARAARCRGRRDRQGPRRLVRRGGNGHRLLPHLPPARPGPGPPPGSLHRSPWHLPARPHRALDPRRRVAGHTCTDPGRPAPPGARDPLGPRVQSAGQGPHRASLWRPPGSPRRGTASRRHRRPRRRQRVPPRFLRRYNRRFAQPAARPQPAYRPWPAHLPPATVFCFKYTRTVANDHTVAVGPHLLQLLPTGRSYAKARVEVHQRLDGTFAIVSSGRPLPVRLLTTAREGEPLRVHRIDQRVRPARRIEPARPPRTTKARRWRPATNHPWRQYDQVRRLKAARAQRTKSLAS